MVFNYYLSVYSNETNELLEKINLGEFTRSELKPFGLDMEYPPYFIGEALLTDPEQMKIIKTKMQNLDIDFLRKSYTLQPLPGR